MYETLKGLAAQLLMPLPMLSMLLGSGLLLCWWGSRRAGALIILLAVAVMLLLSTGPLANALLRPLEDRHAALHEWPVDEAVQAVVVLGGGWAPTLEAPHSARLNDSSAIRLMEGVRLWQQRPTATLVVSGASRDPAIAPVAWGYAEAARDLGVPQSAILTLDRPTDTGQEALAVREGLGEEARFLLVTSASHMPRAMRHFERAGLLPIAAPTHFLAGRSGPESLVFWLPSAGQLRQSERAIYETLGLMAVRWE
jgi:uncharacterized SAM-binding protein YcdF (DUF218 family)